jgi:hypothetical protein
MTEAMEITTFKLVKGRSGDDFIAANADIDAWLKRQPGFRSRRIVEKDDGTIVDLLLWNSAAEAEASMHRLMDELRDSPVHSMIDQRTVSWNVWPVRHFPCTTPRRLERPRAAWLGVLQRSSVIESLGTLGRERQSVILLCRCTRGAAPRPASHGSSLQHIAHS